MKTITLNFDGKTSKSGKLKVYRFFRKMLRSNININRPRRVNESWKEHKINETPVFTFNDNDNRYI